MKKEQKKLWTLIVKYIRLRDGNECQWCGAKVEKSNAHTSHVIPRSHGNVLKYDEQNLKLLCYNCHLHKFHKDPLLAMEWFKNKFPNRYEYLESKRHEVVKFKLWDIENLISIYKDKIKQYENSISG